ncbi:MAG TPA: TMEM175 family protein [Rubrivivax sp.]|nr:TMEM175 family protein [Rubrivivax sp.]
MSPPTAAIDKHRLAALQDGVYAIAMTLLVLDLKLPPLGEHAADALLWSALLGLWPKLLTWLLSFWVLAIFWLGDARALAAVTVVDAFVLRLGLVRLALVSLLPFSTALMGEHGDQVSAAALYSGHLLLLAATQTWRHLYLRRRPGLAASPPDRGAPAFATLACATAAFGLAFVVPAYNMFALMPALLVNLLRRFKPQRGDGGAA